jgi:hypothetical protein
VLEDCWHSHVEGGLTGGPHRERRAEAFHHNGRFARRHLAFAGDDMKELADGLERQNAVVSARAAHQVHGEPMPVPASLSAA